MPEQHGSVSVFKIVGRLLDFVLVEHVAVGHATRAAVGPDNVVETLDALQVHRQALEPVGNLAGYWPAIEAAHLKVGELGDFHAVQPDFPAQAPGTQRGGFPVVFNEANVVDQRVESQCAQTPQIQLLHIGRRRLDHHLELVVVLQPERVVAIATISGPAGGLHIGGAPGLGPNGAQKGGGVKGARAHLHVIGLQNHAAAL